MIATTRPRPFGMRILGALAGLALAFWFETMVYNFRVVGSAHPIGLVIGTGLMALWGAIFVQCVLTSSPPPWLRRLLEDGEVLVGAIVVNLILMNIFSPFLMLLSQIWLAGSLVGSLLPLMLALAGRLSGQVLFVIFVVATIALLWLSLVRLARGVVPASAAMQRVQHAFHVAAIAALALYGVYATALSFNGSLQAPVAVEHRRELVAVTTVNTPLTFPVSWIDLRAPDGTLERITLIVGKDGVWAGYVDPGQAVVVRVRSGFFGIPWIEGVRLDEERGTELLVDAAPSAAVPRRALVRLRLCQSRWADVVAHTRAYLDYYPRDITFARTVAETLRGAGQTQAALEVERLAAEASAKSSS